MAGVVLANIGSETVSIVVFENNLPISLEIFPIGSNDITNDIALGLRVPLEEAENIKRGTIVGGNYPRKKLEEIIEETLLLPYLKRLIQSKILNPVSEFIIARTLGAGATLTVDAKGNEISVQVTKSAKGIEPSPMQRGNGHTATSAKG